MFHLSKFPEDYSLDPQNGLQLRHLITLYAGTPLKSKLAIQHYSNLREVALNFHGYPAYQIREPLLL